MDDVERMAVIESILFVSGEAVKLDKIMEILEMNRRDARQLMERLIDKYNFERRGIQILEADDTYQYATRPEYEEWIVKFTGSRRKNTVSQAALETLAIVAYRQPIARADLELIRGVKCDYTLSVLIERGYVEEVGRLDAPGRPKLYGTTDRFLREFGMSGLSDLPPLPDEEEEPDEYMVT
jgi:segregation and condensation protein B